MKKNHEGTIATKIRPVSATDKGLSAVLYGRPGSGKTHIAGTFPKPVLLLDILQDGTDTIANVPRVDAIPITEWGQIEELYWYLSKGKGKDKYKSVIIDQITEAQDVCIDHVMAEGGRDAMSQRLWGEVSGEMKTFITNFRSLVKQKMNVAFLAHEREDDDEGSEDSQISPNVGPRLMPSVQSFLCGQVSVIGNTFIQEKITRKDGKRIRRVSYAMRIGPHGFYTTKVRHPAEVDTPDVIIDPSFDKILAVVKGRYQPTAKKKVK
jgi:hypothetical protein